MLQDYINPEHSLKDFDFDFAYYISHSLLLVSLNLFFTSSSWTECGTEAATPQLLLRLGYDNLSWYNLPELLTVVHVTTLLLPSHDIVNTSQYGCQESC